MKKIALLFLLVLPAFFVQAQDTAKLYNPAANARQQITDAVKLAKKEHKNVLLQIGGNWCSWCLKFNHLVTTDLDLENYLKKNYVTVHLNYSKENKNEDVLATLGYPQRFGFPVFVILDDKGTRLHTQNSSYLEEGNGHSKAKVMEFLQNWSPEALDPASYKVSK